MKVEIDYEVCMRHSRCHFFHPELFAERDDGFPTVTVEVLSEQHREAINDAISECPTGALSLVEDESSG